MLACDTVRVSDIEILCSFTTTLYHWSWWLQCPPVPSCTLPHSDGPAVLTASSRWQSGEWSGAVVVTDREGGRDSWSIMTTPALLSSRVLRSLTAWRKSDQIKTSPQRKPRARGKKLEESWLDEEISDSNCDTLEIITPSLSDLQFKYNWNINSFVDKVRTLIHLYAINSTFWHF